MSLKKDALHYHEFPTPGKLAVVPTKPCETAHDLALAYSPGVAEPCLRIEKNPEDAYRYTAKGNLVAVISNGTAVLGLGDIGALAGKPVMEGKAVLFKSFADIDVFDLELDCKDPEKLVDMIAALAPSFGGINLEDIKAPECFYIEQELQRRLQIPVFHDDQHGTAIVTAAAFLNGLLLTKRSIETVRLVANGAGASALACVRLLISLGLPRQNVILCDTTGVIYRGRSSGMNSFKAEFAADTEARTLADALVGADVFLGLSSKGALLPEMLAQMAPNPLVFAMANPDPEIEYEVARAARPDAILATGRSDYPNQINNVLGFPYIFRGALDCRARAINEPMKLAAVHALAALARESVPDTVRRAYAQQDFSFGTEYLIPKPFDPRVLYYVAPAVAKAAMESGVAGLSLDIAAYTLRLKGKQNHGREMLDCYYHLARKSKHKRIVFPDAANPKIIKAALMAQAEGLADPIFIGVQAKIEEIAKRLEVDISGIQIIEPDRDSRCEQYAQALFNSQARRGVTRSIARKELTRSHIFGTMMVASGDADGMVCGVERNYPQLVRPILRHIGPRPGVKTCAGMYIVSIRGRLLFFADTAINITLNSEQLAEVGLLTAEFAASMNVQPRVAFLSFSNFGSSEHSASQVVRGAKDMLQARAPHLQVEGEMQADTALQLDVLREHYPFCTLDGPANVLIFPDMQSGNIAFKLLQHLGGARVVGPVILGLRAPAYVVQRHADVDEIFNMITVASAQASLIARNVGRRLEVEVSTTGLSKGAPSKGKAKPVSSAKKAASIGQVGKAG
jgi:malate dehydrogenase (oxaloacetate-decarboxylating)(NADP+)